ncbi:MAG: MMPL family transporter, partial [Myxococcota bacterium]
SRSRIVGWLVGLSEISARRPGVVLLFAVVLSALSGWGVVAHLGVSSETDDIFDASLPFRERRDALYRAFPMLEDPVLVVVDAPSDTRARAAVRWLAAELRADPERFRDVFVPGDGEFFEKNGLLYLEPDALEELVDDLALAQPFLAELSRDRSLRGLFDLLSRAVELSPQLGGFELDRVLGHVGEAVQGAALFRATPTRFDDLVLGRRGTDGGGRRFLMVQPRPDFSDFVPARPGMLRLREILPEIGAGEREGASARMTGDLALQFEEFESVRGQATVAGATSFVLVSILLAISLRSTRLILGTVVALLLGLLWTAGAAALVVGHLNVISVAFAVLFIGLAVDFGLHYSLRYRELRANGEEHANALRGTSETVGVSIALCASTTAVGFFSFLPTGYRGVSELGVIAGCGMLIAVLATLTVLPAIMSVGLVAGEPPRPTARWPLPRFPGRHPGVILATGTLLTGAATVGALRWEFDPNPLHVRDPNTEGVRTFEELLANGELHPWSAEWLVPDLATAEQFAERARQLDSVNRVLTLHSYVPTGQAAKLETIGDARLLLNLGDAAGRDPASDDEVVETIRAFRASLDVVKPNGIDPPLFDTAQKLAADLDALLAGPLAGGERAATLRALDESLVRPIVTRLAELQEALRAAPVALEDVPEQLRRRMVAPDGRARVQVFAAGDLNDNRELVEFYEQLQTIAPDASGTSAYMVESARFIRSALEQAFLLAACAITALLLFLWRSLADTVRVLVPLGCAALFTAGAASVIGPPLNFADVIVLPLLLGIGVDTGIHLVHRFRSGEHRDIMGTSTSQAVVWSALTTIASFGALGLTAHRGMASLGQLLTLGVGFTLAANLILLPALLALGRKRGR